MCRRFGQRAGASGSARVGSSRSDSTLPPASSAIGHVPRPAGACRPPRSVRPTSLPLACASGARSAHRPVDSCTRRTIRGPPPPRRARDARKRDRTPPRPAVGAWDANERRRASFPLPTPPRARGPCGRPPRRRVTDETPLRPGTRPDRSERRGTLRTPATRGAHPGARTSRGGRWWGRCWRRRPHRSRTRDPSHRARSHTGTPSRRRWSRPG